MGRNKKIETAKSEDSMNDVATEETENITAPETQSEANTPAINDIDEVKEAPFKEEEIEEISPRDAELMRLYPQYEEIWITPDGFVHPKEVAKYLIKDAKLFKNKYFNKSK